MAVCTLSLAFKDTPDLTMSGEDADWYDDGPYLCEISDFNTINGAIFASIFVLGFAGNVLVISVLLLGEKLKGVTSVFVVNLACSDLLFTLTLPFWAYYQLHHWLFGEYACKLVTAAYITGMYSSVILLTAITVDRFVTVVLQWPNDPARRKRFAAVSCAAAWIISGAASVNDAINVKVETQWDNLSSCEDFSQDSEVNLGYYLQVSLLFFLPLAIILFCSAVIIKTILRTSIRRTSWPVVMILCIVSVFFICWGPYNIILITKAFYQPQSCYAHQRLYDAYSVCRIIAYSHCCLNPVLYMMPRTYRKHVWKVLQCRNSKKKERDAAVGQSTTTLNNAAFAAKNATVTLTQSVFSLVEASSNR